MFHCLIFNFEKKNASRQLGPYRIAHWLRENQWDAEVVDFALHFSLDELAELVRSRITENTKFIGFSFLFNGWPLLAESFAIFLKQEYPDIILIAGSSSLIYEHMSVDYYVWGFGEVAIIKLLKNLFSNGAAISTTKHFATQLINSLEYPAYPLDNYSVEYQPRDFLEPWEFLSIETGRGCRFKCTFCSFSILGVKDDHSTSANSFEHQLNTNYNRWGIKNYIIAEETFNDRTEKLSKFSSIVQKLNFDPWFSAFIRFDLLLSRNDDKKILEDMNVLGQYYGIETFNNHSAKLFRKGTDSDKIKQGLIDIKSYYKNHSKNYRGTISLIIGAPYEDPTSILNTRDWLIKNWSDQSIATYPLTIPVTGQLSDLTRNYKKYGYEEISYNSLENKHPTENDILATIKSRSKNSLIWKNSEMDLVEAYKLNLLFNEARDKYNFKKSPFLLSEFTGENSTLEEKLKLQYTASETNMFKKEENRWYREYKLKKLNWTK